MKKRRGYSLVECLITIGLIGAVLSIVAVVTNRVHCSCRRVAETSAAELELERFSAQLRSDAHRAVSVEKVEGNGDETPFTGLLLELADGSSVNYSLHTDYLERLRRPAGEAAQRETYRFPKSFSAVWQIDQERPRPLVSLRMDPTADIGTYNSIGMRSIRINAAVGVLPRPFSPEES